MTTSIARSPTRCVVMEEDLTSVVVKLMTTAGKSSPVQIIKNFMLSV